MLNQVLMYFIIYTCLYTTQQYLILFSKNFMKLFINQITMDTFYNICFRLQFFAKHIFVLQKKIVEGTTTYWICWPISTYEIVLTFLMLWKTFFQSRKFIIFAKIFVDDNHLQKWRGTYDNVWTFPINTWWLNIKEK